MGNQQRSTQENDEVFKQHPVYHRLEIGDKGTVRDFKTKRVRYTCVSKQGYLSFNYKIEGKPKCLKVHRLVAEVHLDAPSKELIDKCSNEHWGVVLVKHLDNNKLNNHKENLEWSDLEGNTKQAWGDGLCSGLAGELNGRAELTEKVVHEICKDYELGMKPRDAVIKYGISRQQSTKIRAGYQWRHIWELYDIKVNRRNTGKRSTTIP